MFVVISHFKIKKECVEIFKDVSKELVLRSREDEGNIAFTLNQAIEDETKFCSYSSWEDKMAFDDHNHTEHMIKILPQLAVLCEVQPQLHVFNEICY